jgi:hypothetical protein
MKTKTFLIHVVIFAIMLYAANPVLSQNWVKVNSPGGIMNSLAGSADGTTLVTANQNGAVAVSTNWGATWTPTGISAMTVACSSNGMKLISAGYPSGGSIYTSTNWGASWIQRTNAPVTFWQSVASSSDGTKLVAANQNGAYNSFIYTSTDSGVTWTAPGWPWDSWQSVACSADGTKLVALSWGSYGRIYYSGNSGASWNYANSPSGPRWQAVTSSADGTKMVAVVFYGQIYRSIDSGHNWTILTNSASTSWISVASSADGSTLIAGVDYGGVYVSTNFGTSWSETSLTGGWWEGVACSGDATKFAAMDLYGSVYVSQPAPVLSITSTNTSLILSWPSSAMGYELMQCSDLTVTNWANVTNSVGLVGNQNQVVIPMSANSCFYRLQFP